MTNYYIEQNGKIIGVDTNKETLQTTLEKTLKLQPQYTDLEIKETERPLGLSDNFEYYVFADTDEYLQKQEQKEKERIAKLSLTRGDVFRGILQAKGVTKEQIAQMIEAMPATNAEEILKKELAKIDFEDALNFYRGVELIDTIGTALGITSEQLDEFFETNDYTKLM